MEFLADPAKMGEYQMSVFQSQGLYLVAVVFTQLIVNISMITSKCGGSSGQNLGAAFLITLIPWILIFGVLMMFLIAYPGFLTPMSNIIGYYYVSGSANTILNKLLVNVDLNEQIDESTDGDKKQKADLKSAAEAIVKLCGNTSILINQITPNSFNKNWEMLLPLMKEEYKRVDGGPLKQQFLDLVVSRTNVGEVMWYFYTAILLTSITQFSIASRPCNTDLTTKLERQALYKEQQAAIDKQNAVSTSTVYTS
jgi:hypothetical protein